MGKAMGEMALYDPSAAHELMIKCRGDLTNA